MPDRNLSTSARSNSDCLARSPAEPSIWLAAVDERIRCAAPSCSGATFRENPAPLHWSRDYWYIYFPQIREEFLGGRKV